MVTYLFLFIGQWIWAGVTKRIDYSGWVWLNDWEASQSLVLKPVKYWGVVSHSLNAVLWGKESDKSCNYPVLLQQIARFLKNRQTGWGNISSNEYCDGWGRLMQLSSELLLGHCCWSVATNRSWAHYCEICRIDEYWVSRLYMFGSLISMYVSVNLV